MSLERRSLRVRASASRSARRALDPRSTHRPAPRREKLAIDFGAPPQPTAADTLILRLSGQTLQLVGGTGRGAGWMGIVDLPLASEPIARAVLSSSRPTHVDAKDEAVRVVGPYWAMHAFLVPVGANHLVVYGGSQAL